MLAREDSRAAAVREVGEELGITLDPADGLLLRTLRYYEALFQEDIPC